MAVMTRLLPALLVVVGCSLVEDPLAGIAGGSGHDRFPDVLAAELHPREDGRYDLRVTISSPYDTPQRYADGWRVLDAEGFELGVHTLLHDHAGEQPFSRTMRGLSLPPGTRHITVEGRDQVYGYGGATVALEVPQR